MLDAIANLALLLGLELVLGVDNIVVISILVSRLDPSQRNKARIIGLTLAMVARIVMLFGVIALVGITAPIIWHLSIRDLVMLAGGLFLMTKAVKEIHHTVEHDDETHTSDKPSTFSAVIWQIVLLDLVFSVDSVITAIGLTEHLWIIVTAVVAAFAVILWFAKPVGDFILKNPALKILALAFLVTIGVTLCLEGFHHHVPKGYIYLPMGFALIIEFLQMRHAAKRRKAK